MGKVFFCFVAATLLEIFVFIEVGSAIGAWSTIGLILLSAIVGLSLVRVQGFQTLMAAQRKVSLGEPPAREMLGGIMLALSGLLLVLPGFVSDMCGLLLLLPPVRQALVEGLLRRMKVPMGQQGQTFTAEYTEYHSANSADQRARLEQSLTSHQRDQASGTTFEGDFQRKDDDK